MMQFISRAYAATKLLGKAHAPTIMVTTGVVSMGVGAVIGCKKTLKVESVLEPHVAKLDDVSKGLGMALDSYTSSDARNDRFKIYTRTALDLTRLYAVPGVLFVGGTALVLGGHRILLQRNATLAVAFTGLKATFDAYRARVVDQWGTEADQALYGGYTLKEVGDGEGNTTTIPQRDWDTARQDPYNRVFEQGATSQWDPDLGINKMFISQQQRFANERLSRTGVLYLCDVYKSLGFPETDISRVVGWKTRQLPDGSKDIPFVDFGLDKPHHDDFKYGPNHSVYLDFNCQGLIVGGQVQKILEQA